MFSRDLCHSFETIEYKWIFNFRTANILFKYRSFAGKAGFYTEVPVFFSLIKNGDEKPKGNKAHFLMSHVRYLKSTH